MFRSCRGCSERTPGCHGYCENYKRERAEYEKKKKESKTANEYDAYLYGKHVERRNAEAKIKQHNRRWRRNASRR